MARLKEIYVTSRDPFERGVQHGSQVREEIRRGREGYQRAFLAKGTSWEEARGMAMEYVPLLEAALPELLAEARGIAQGAGADLADVMVLNTRYELLKFPKGAEKTPARLQDQECTLYGVEPPASAAGETMVGQNWDNAPFVGENLYLLHLDEGNGTRILALTEPAQLVRSGMNSHGVGLSCATLLSTEDCPGPAVPTNFLRRRLLQCRSMGEAQGVLREFRPRVSLSYLVGSARDRAVRLAETNPLETYWVEPVRGVLGHGNDFLANPRIDRFHRDRPGEGRQFRGQRLWRILAERAEEITPQVLMECLRDHEGYPSSVCNHQPQEGLLTIASTIYCLDRGCAYICRGLPCQNDYERYDL